MIIIGMSALLFIYNLSIGAQLEVINAFCRFSIMIWKLCLFLIGC